MIEAPKIVTTPPGWNPIEYASFLLHDRRFHFFSVCRLTVIRFDWLTAALPIAAPAGPATVCGFRCLPKPKASRSGYTPLVTESLMFDVLPQLTETPVGIKPIELVLLGS